VPGDSQESLLGPRSPGQSQAGAASRPAGLFDVWSWARRHAV